VTQCSPADVAQIVIAAFTVVTGIGAVIAALASLRQARMTAEVNSVTLENLREERERRTGDRAYRFWLRDHLVSKKYETRISRNQSTAAEREFIDRAVEEGFLVADRAAEQGVFLWR